MADKYLELLVTPAVAEAQTHYFGRSMDIQGVREADALTEPELQFIASRDSFYMASISGSGWPYLQHRGGPAGFLQALSPRLLAFADYRGNRQLLSTGNFATNDRVSLFLMDYPRRMRLKILGRARVEDARKNPEWVARLAKPELARSVERIVFIEVVSFDWNCPKYITPRFTAAEVEDLLSPLRQRIAELERETQGHS